MSADTLFPLIATFVVRYIFVRFIARCAYAIGLYDTLARRMQEADRKYEAELSHGRLSARLDAPAAPQ
jgi:hypothetical protein